MKNYYEILEVSQNASSEVIEKAYKALAKKYHPDANLDNIQEAEDKFKEIGEAYEILSDATKKAEYDYELELYLNSNNNSAEYNINNEDYENLASHARELEYELESLKRNNTTSNNTASNNTVSNNITQQSIDELASSLSDTINQAYSKAYQDAYIKRLRDYGYRIKYKKPFKTVIKNFFSSIISIIILILLLSIILFILWQIPSIRNYFTNFYNNNYLLQLIGNTLKQI